MGTPTTHQPGPDGNPTVVPISTSSPKPVSPAMAPQTALRIVMGGIIGEER